MNKINIAIDGPAGAGKSTVAKLVATQSHYLYIDTGAMYRALTWQAIQQDVDVHSGELLSHLLKQIEITLQPSPNGQKVFVNQQDVTEVIRSREVTNNVSFVAAQAEVREKMLHLQRKLAEQKGVVMDGRDIGTHILPDAEVKIFLSASIEERAKRRFLEVKQKGLEISLEEIKEDIILRDKRDTSREVAPLKKAEDAIELDTTGLSIEQVVQAIVEIVEQKQAD